MVRLNPSQIRVAGWTGVVLVGVGQLLPWGYRSRPIGQVWDWLFSPVSNPNLEWWVWLLGPALAAVIAAKGLLENNQVPRVAAAPAIIFFGIWIFLIVGGVKRYVSTTQAAPMLTIIGLLILTALAFFAGAKRPVRRAAVAPR